MLEDNKIFPEPHKITSMIGDKEAIIIEFQGKKFYINKDEWNECRKFTGLPPIIYDSERKPERKFYF